MIAYLKVTETKPPYVRFADVQHGGNTFSAKVSETVTEGAVYRCIARPLLIQNKAQEWRFILEITILHKLTDQEVANL